MCDFKQTIILSHNLVAYPVCGTFICIEGWLIYDLLLFFLFLTNVILKCFLWRNSMEFYHMHSISREKLAISREKLERKSRWLTIVTGLVKPPHSPLDTITGGFSAVFLSYQNLAQLWFSTFSFIWQIAVRFWKVIQSSTIQPGNKVQFFVTIAISVRKF